MTDQAYNPTNYCYRHPDRQSFVLCQRCGRTICPECQTPAAVGVHCPECVREQRAAFSANRRSSGAPSRLTVAGRRFAMMDQKATVVLVGLSVVVWLLDQVTGGRLISNALLYAPPYLPTQPWRLVTSLFVHGSIFHIAFNMWALWVFGRMLENMLGTWRFLALYFISGVAGGLAVTWLAPYTAVIGASGAIFGLFAAFFVLQRSLGNNAVQLLVIMGLNLAIGFIPGVGIAWQAHLGGIVAGFVVGFVFTRTRNIRQRGLQITLLSVVAVAVVVLTYVGYAVRLG